MINKLQTICYSFVNSPKYDKFFSFGEGESSFFNYICDKFYDIQQIPIGEVKKSLFFFGLSLCFILTVFQSNSQIIQPQSTGSASDVLQDAGCQILSSPSLLNLFFDIETEIEDDDLETYSKSSVLKAKIASLQSSSVELTSFIKPTIHLYILFHSWTSFLF